MNYLALLIIVASPLAFGAAACPSPGVADGSYFIVSVGDHHWCVDTPKDEILKVQKMDCNHAKTEMFFLGRRTENCYLIAATFQGNDAQFLLSAWYSPCGGCDKEYLVQRLPYASTTPSEKLYRWYVEKIPNKPGVYRIVSADETSWPGGKRCMELPPEARGASIRTATCSKTDASQEWVLQPVT